MSLVTISIIIAMATFIAYNTISVNNFGVPHSLSETYYLWKGKCNGGWLFCVMMYLVVALMMPAWITMSEGSAFQFLAFLAPVSLLFVGTAPAFLSSDLENNVHTVSAILAAVFSLAWIVLVTPYWWVILVWAGVVALMAILTKTVKTSYTYWLEMIAFGATFNATIMYSIWKISNFI